MNGCPFCETAARPAIAESELAFALADLYPASPGHALVVPRRHVETYLGCTSTEKAELWVLVDRVCETLSAERRPTGFNVGFNAGASAGQTVMHAHVHVIPRYDGDVADPRGGVRHAVVGRGYYTPVKR